MVHSPRKNAGRNPAPNAFKPAEFVNISLEPKQRDELKASIWGVDEFESAFAALCVDGYSLKLRYDERNDCFSAWLLPRDGSKNSGWILSGRGSTAMRAVKQVCYIHFKLLEGDWTEGQARNNEPLDD